MTSLSACAPPNVLFADLNVSAQGSLRRYSDIQTGSLRRGRDRAWAIVSLAAALLLAGAVGASAQAPGLEPAWNQQNPSSSPSARYLHALTYDASHGQVVLFGGIGASGSPLNDTWLWNGTAWTQATPTNSPTARDAFAMTYDATQGNVMLFGGRLNANTWTNDTWLWNGSNWSNANPATSPGPRSNMTVVYDPAQGNDVMFGGLVSGLAASDTWIWNGTTWAQANPATSPSARSAYSLVYDAATGNVVLFGGRDASGNTLSDTWLWNGTTWTQLTPANSPSARYGQGMAYDPALGGVVMFGGIDSSGNYLNDAWLWNGSSWIQITSGPSAREVPNAMTYDSAQGQLIMFGGYYNVSVTITFADTWEYGTPQNFGGINVCPGGQTSPAPCSNTLTLTYGISTTTTFGTPEVVTQGSTGFDFSLASGGSCAGTVIANSSCTLNVTFAPQAPGVRQGAVELFDNSGNLLATTPIYGTGEGSLATFSPLTTFVQNSGGQSLNAPEGVAVDVAGDVFIADTGNQRVLKVVGNSAQVVASGLSSPQGVALDGAGNLYVADSLLGGTGEVVKLAPGCTSSSCWSVLYTAQGPHPGPFSVAVDGAGDVFVADNPNGVFEIPANGSGQTLLYNPGGNSQPTGVAVDGVGDLFISDSGLHQVLEFPVACGISCQKTIGLGWGNPASVAVDAAGDVIVADSGTDEVVEVPVGCTIQACQIILAYPPFPSLAGTFQPYDAVPDGQGDFYIADVANNRIDAILPENQAFDFAESSVGNISGDSPRSILFQNVGNQTLAATAPGLVFMDPNFYQSSGPGTYGTPADCTATFSLGPGAACNMSVSFDPLASGSLTGYADFYDNSLNNPAALQAFPFVGTGVPYGTEYALTVTEGSSGGGTVTDNLTAINCSLANGNTTGMCSGSYESGVQVTLTANAVAGSTFTGWGGACASSGTNAQCTLTMNGPANVTADFAPVGNFGSVNVCPGGNISGCTGSGQAVNFNLPANTTITSVQVVTQGLSNLDFQLGSGNTCTGTFSTAGSCTVNVNFTPLAPGLRLGALELLNNGSVVATQEISGIGQAPEIAFGPGSPAAVNLGSYSLSSPVAVDAAGNIYFAASGQLLEKTSAGIQTVSSGPFYAPAGLAVDGAGDVFVADDEQGKVFEVPANGGALSTIYPPSGVYGAPYGVAVDGEGDVFVADSEEQEVVEIPVNGGANTVVYGPQSSGASPVDVAVDGAGDVFIAMDYPGSIVEIPAGCANTSCQTTVGTGWNQPASLAVDAAGDLFVSDPGLSGGNGVITAVSPGCTGANASASCETVLADGGSITGGVNSYGVALDSQGDIYYLNIGSNESGEGTGIAQLNEIARSQPPSLSFGSINEGSSSAPQTVTMQNIGNQPLAAISPGLAESDPDFGIAGPQGACPANFSLVAGATCTLNYYFAPINSGPLSGTAYIDDNALNNSTTFPTQSIGLTGTGVPLTTNYTLTVADIGSGSGIVMDNVDLITCNETNGSTSGLCSGSYPSGQNVTLSATAITGSTFTGWGGACASYGTSTQCIVTMNAAESVTANFARGSFGSVNVCTGGSPSGCTGSSQAVTFNFTVSSTVNSVQVVTQGVTGLDFQEANDTCSGNTFSSGQSCTVNVNFTPTAPGLRLGAVELLDSGGNLLATQLISGIGQGPAAAFSPGTQTTVPTTSLNYPVGVALDGAGNLYVANYGSYPNSPGYVVKITPGGVQTTVLSAYTFAPGQFPSPIGVAVDGAGDLFIADLSLPYAVKVTPSGVQTTVGSGLGGYSTGIALDAMGDVFIADQGNTRVVEVTPAGVQTTVPATGLQQPWGVATDAAGDVFIADGDQTQGITPRVVEVTPSGVQTTVPTTGLSRPYHLAVDAAGDVIIDDSLNGRVVEVSPSGVQTTLVSGLGFPSGVTVDPAGDVFIGDQGNQKVYEVNRSQGQSVNLGLISQNYQSSDSPISVQNVGNQTLTGSVGPVTGAYIFEDSGTSTCGNGGGLTLSPGSSCVENFYSNTPTVGSINGTAVVSDNSLNGAPATQTISIAGLSEGPPVTVSATGSGTGSGFVESNPTGINCDFIAGVASGTCSQSISTGLTDSFEEVPTAGSTFTGWGGACASAGTNQICVVPITTAATVTASFASSATYMLTVTDAGNGSGTVTTGDGLISCSQAGGTGSGTCSSSYPANSPVTLTASPAAGSAFVGWGGACATFGTSPTCTVAMSSAMNVSATFSQQSFGPVNVCPTGQSTPAPCSITIPVTFNIPTTTTIGVIQVVTQGVTGLDFSLGSGSTCTGTITGPSSCNVNVTFTPLAPGSRLGAVELYDNNGNVIADAPVYGIGQAPVSAFSPSAQVPISTGSFTLSEPNGLLIDAAGNLFISDSTTQQVLKIAPNGSVSTVGSGFEFPQGMAEDGAGDLFVANNNLNQVVEIPSGCTTGSCQKYLPNTLNLKSQLGVAVDGAGDVFIGDYLDGEVAEIPANGGAETSAYNPGGGSHPADLSADAAGNLYIADFGLKTVVEVPKGCTSASCQKTIGSGWSQPDGVAVDAAGNVFVADAGLNEVMEVPYGCATSACQTVLVSGLGSVAVKVDAKGDLVIDDLVHKQILEVTRSQPPSLGFALTNVGSTSSDSPQSVSIQNVGNQPLGGTVALNLGTNFAQNTGSTCGSGFTLAPGAICSESFSFTPQSTGYQAGTAAFSDNTMNLSAAVVLQTINLSGNGGLNGQPVGVAVPNVVGLVQAEASTTITGSGLAPGTVSTASSSVVPTGSVIDENPAAGTIVNPGSAVRLLVSTGQAPPPTPNPLSLLNNYFVTGDYAAAGVTLRSSGAGNAASGTITIPDSTTSPGVQGVPDGADLIDGFLYWMTVEQTTSPSGNAGTFLGYPITGQQIGSDIPYTDGSLTGTLRVYRADINEYFQAAANGSGVRTGSGAFSVSFSNSGGTLTEGASLVVIYRVLSPSFPLKSIVIYDGSTVPTASNSQNMQGFYDALGGATGESTTLSYASGSWNNSSTSVTLASHASQYVAPLNAASAYGALIFSTPVTNSDNDGILDAWKAGPTAGDFYTGESGYYDVKTGEWVPLPGAVHGEKDLFVQLDYMCGAVLADGSCDPNQENLFPSPDAQGNDPLTMVKSAFAADGVVLHLEIGNAVPESTCTDSTSTNPPQLCQFPSEPGVIGWKNSLEFSKIWPKNLASCAAGGDCSPRFPYGQKDSYHYVLFGHSLAIPAWNTPYQTLTSIQVANGITTFVTTDRGTGINACPSRITISGVLGSPSLNGVYNTTSCPDTKTIIAATPGVPNWSYPNSTMPEPEIGLTSGTVTSISGYSDLGGADSAVTLGLWETDPKQDMSKRAQVVAGTLFHEIGHTLGLTHGGRYYDNLPSYVPTYEENCKPNFQSTMNYLFQLDGVGPNSVISYSNQNLETLNKSSLGSVSSLTDGSGNAATFPTSAWYSSTAPSTTASSASLHCDGTPLAGDTGYRVDGPIAPVTPPWSNGQNIIFDGVPPNGTIPFDPLPYTTLRGYNDVANLDLRQVGATGGEFASLASVLSFGSSQAPLNIAAGGSVTVGAGGTVALGSGGTVALGSGGTVTLGSGGTIALGSGGSVTLNNGGSATLPSSGGTIALGSGGTVALGSGGTVTLGSGGTITLGSGGTVALGSGGTVTLGSGGTIALGSGGSVTIPSTGGSYTLDDSGGTITLGSGGTVALGSGGTVTLGSGGTIALGSGGTIALGSGGTVTLGSGGTITLGSGGTIALGSGGTVTLGSGGTIALGSGGTVTLGSGGTIALGSGGTVTLGSGGDVSVGSGGTIALGSGGTVTLGSGGTVALGSGGNVTIPSSGGTIALGSGGTIALGSGGTVTLGSGGTITLGSGGSPIQIAAGGSYTIPSGGGTIALGSGGTVTLGSGGNATLPSSGGTITLGSGGTIALGSGGTVTLGSGGVIALGSGGTIALGSGGTIALGSGGTIALGSGGASTSELNYDTANSVVRPPTSPTYTVTPVGIQVNWMAPAFGVVQTYTISRSVNGGPPVVIGSVSGVNGYAPATTFTDTNPPTGTLVYTISTTVVPDTTNPAPRQSAPSPPAVLTLNQTIVLGSLPSSVSISTSPLTVTATAESNGVANGLLVSFSATGSCSAGSPSMNTATGVSSAIVTLSSTGSCTITASQAGDSTTAPTGANAYNAASSVSGTFMILPQGSTTQSQTISFGPLPNVGYGGAFTLSATSSAGLAVSFAASGPCTTSGTTTGVGRCTITASAPAANNYSAASASQSFSVLPAVISVTANNIASVYGQQIPALTYGYSGFVNGDLASVVNGAPALSTAATAGSNPGSYPITVSTGSLAATNYSFLYVNGVLTLQPAPLTITASNGVMAFGGIVPPIAPAFSGFVNGDTSASLTTQPICGAGVTSQSPIGSYPIVCTGAADSNYTITYAPGTLMIAPTSTSISLVSSTGGTSNYGQLVTITPTVTGTPVPPGTDSVLYSYTNSNINSGVSVPLGSVPLSGGYSTFLLPPGTNIITATFDGDNSDGNYQASSASVTQVVASVPVAYISPSSATFPNTDVGSTSASISVVLTNIGTAPLNITGVQMVSGDSGPADFIVQSSTCGNALQPGQMPLGPQAVAWGFAAPSAARPAPGSTVSADNSCSVTLAFAPNPKQGEGTRTGSLVFSDNDGGQAGASDYIALTGSALSGISATFPMPPTKTIAAGNYIWFNSELSVQGPLDPTGNPLNMNKDEVQVMVTNGSISFTNPATGTTSTIPVPDALIQFVPGLTQASTTFDAANNRWVTQVPMADPASGRSQFVMPGNIFVTGVPYLVPAAISQALGGGGSASPQNVTWSAEFTTDTPGVRLNWQWGAAVYNSCLGNQPTSSNPTCAGDSLNPANLDVLGVNSADPGKCPITHTNNYNAGTPYSFLTDIVLPGRQNDSPNLYTGQTSPMAGVVPAVTPVTFTPIPLVFMPVNAGQSSSPMMVTITNDNQSLPLNISGVTLTGSNSADFAITGTTCTNANGAATVSAKSVGALTLAPVSGGAADSCTLTIVFTPGDLGTRTSSLMFTYATPAGMAPNETPPPQTVDLYGTGAGGSNPIVGLSAVSLNFPNLEQGTTSASQTVVLVNAGGGALAINSIAPGGEFGESNTCPAYPSTLPSGGTCTISVWFQPLAHAIGAQPGAITITDNNNGVNGSTQSITLSGKALP